MAGRNNAYMSPAQRRAIANSRQVQDAIHRRVVRGRAAFTAAATKRSGDLAAHVRVERTRSPRSGVKGYALVAYPGAAGDRRPNAPVPILFGTAKQRPDRAMESARRAIEGA